VDKTIKKLEDELSRATRAVAVFLRIGSIIALIFLAGLLAYLFLIR
jgi:hypothetical protein